MRAIYALCFIAAITSGPHGLTRRGDSRNTSAGRATTPANTRSYRLLCCITLTDRSPITLNGSLSRLTLVVILPRVITWFGIPTLLRTRARL